MQREREREGERERESSKSRSRSRKCERYGPGDFWQSRPPTVKEDARVNTG